MARQIRTYAPATIEALSLFGVLIASERRRQRLTAAELAERAGVSLPTLRGAERGAPSVAAGVYFELATILRIRLFGTDPRDLGSVAGRERDRLALLPASVRELPDIDDDF